MKGRILLIVSLMLSYTISFASENHNSHTGLDEFNLSTKNATIQIDNSNDWVKFEKSTTKKAYRAYGKPISVSGYETVNPDNIEEISLRFIEENQDLLGVDKSNVVFSNSNYINGKWYVHLKQKINNLLVAFSGIELKINNKAQIFSYGVEYYDTKEIDLNPRISFDKAYLFETKLNPNEKFFMNSENSGELYAFPIYENGSYRLEAAYRAEYKIDNRDYSAYISSINGKTLFRKKLTHELKTDVEIYTNIKEESALSPVIRVPARHQTIRIKGKQYTTNKDGKLTLDLNSDEQITINFEGPWVKFENKVFTQGKIDTEIIAGENNIIEWDNNNSDIRERMVVHHLNKIRDYYKAFDTTKKAMDFQLELLFDDRDFGGPNAYSSGETIGFVGMDDKSARLSETPTVLYHEYGHSINKLLFQELGQREGMINGAANEGIADITAALMVDDPRVGYGAFTADPNRIIRNCKNNFKYPDDIIGESHHDGQIIAGAFWDLRELTDLETVRNLAHFSRYGLPDDEENDVCFSEWLIEVLVADDDDGNLTNGTPHSQQIITAFDNHNIGFDIMLRKGLNHNQKVDLLTNGNIITLFGDIIEESNFNKDSLELSLIYSFDNFKTKTEIPFSVENNQNNGFKFVVNSEKSFALMSYYFNVKNVTTGKLTEKIGTPEGKTTFRYEYGFVEKQREFLNKNEWEFKRQGIQQGAELEIAKPDEFDYSIIGLNVAQTSDSDDSDDISIVTGASATTQTFFNSVPFTNLQGYSPLYDIENYYYPVLKFKTWHSKQAFDPSADVDLFIYLSSDAGKTWKEAFKLDDNTNAQKNWNQQYIIIKDFVENTSQFKFAIRISPNSNFSVSSGFPTCFSEFQVDDISIIDPSSVSSVESELSNQYRVTTDKNTISIFSNSVSSTINKVNLFDINGRVLSSESNPNNNETVVLRRNNLTTGVYFLEISNGKTSITKQILIN